MLPVNALRPFKLRSDQTACAVNTVIGAVLAVALVPLWGMMIAVFVVSMGTYQIVFGETRARREEHERESLELRLRVLETMDEKRDAKFFEEVGKLRDDLALLTATLLAPDAPDIDEAEQRQRSIAERGALLTFATDYQHAFEQIAEGLAERGQPLGISREACTPTRLEHLLEIESALDTVLAED